MLRIRDLVKQAGKGAIAATRIILFGACKFIGEFLRDLTGNRKKLEVSSSFPQVLFHGRGIDPLPEGLHRDIFVHIKSDVAKEQGRREPNLRRSIESRKQGSRNDVVLALRQAVDDVAPVPFVILGGESDSMGIR